jgi:hypothetical protein
MKRSTLIALNAGVGCIALLFYPLVLMANVMSIGILNRMEEGDLAAKAFATFMWWSSGYPLVYLPCMIMVGLFVYVDAEDLAVYVSAIPVLFIALLIGLFVFAIMYGA